MKEFEPLIGEWHGEGEIRVSVRADGLPPPIPHPMRPVDVLGQLLNAPGEPRHLLGQVGVLPEQVDVRPRQLFTVPRISLGVGLVAVGLTGLSEQDQRRRVRGLEAEREVEQDERIGVVRRDAHRVDDDPDGDNDRLGDEECRGAEETGEVLGSLAESAAAESGGQVFVAGVETEMRHCGPPGPVEIAPSARQPATFSV